MSRGLLRSKRAQQVDALVRYSWRLAKLYSEEVLVAPEEVFARERVSRICRSMVECHASLRVRVAVSPSLAEWHKFEIVNCCWKLRHFKPTRGKFRGWIVCKNSIGSLWVAVVGIDQSVINRSLLGSARRLATWSNAKTFPDAASSHLHPSASLRHFPTLTSTLGRLRLQESLGQIAG